MKFSTKISPVNVTKYVLTYFLNEPQLFSKPEGRSSAPQFLWELRYRVIERTLRQRETYLNSYASFLKVSRIGKDIVFR